MQYTISARFFGAGKGRHPIHDFVKKMQVQVYDKGFVDGFFEVTAQDGDDLLVKFERSLEDDEDYARERQPDNIVLGYEQQLKAELDEAGTPYPFLLLCDFQVQLK